MKKPTPPRLPGHPTGAPPSAHQLPPGLLLDPRRALWLPAYRALVVADLHLGYPWAQRHSGNLLPISTPDDTLDRLAALARHYQPAQIILLGDIVHRALPIPALRDQLHTLLTLLTPAAIHLIAGNHDTGLPALLRRLALPAVTLHPHLPLGPHILAHGDQPIALPPPGGWLILGHEHPAIHLGDSIATTLKCPCFLAGAPILILPAFSTWAAGASIRTGAFLSPIARQARFTHAYAILAARILPVPL